MSTESAKINLEVSRLYMTSTQWAYLYALAWLDDEVGTHDHALGHDDCKNFKCLLERDPLEAATKAEDYAKCHGIADGGVFKDFIHSFQRVTEIESPPSPLEGYSLDVIREILSAEPSKAFALVLPGPTTC
ncbi:MAG: hypothetical protein GWN00_31475 [Aliifodinibius sp.]|nr:hypothetical protein [Fodinibius sp.]NIW48349.1 hypothetical protein [Gammaproteobacteria bacterium]NIW97758.1 hypothetical protein [Phycisphaerae bacterium]NIY29143.1 hypothetical protein [Fodinibius sp.]